MKDLSELSIRPAFSGEALRQIRRLPPRCALPTVHVLNALLVSSLALGTVQLGTVQAAPAAPAPPLNLSLIGGSVEVQGQVWGQAQKGQPVRTALRTGTGRAVLSGPGNGKLMLGSSSLMRVYNNQPDVQSGRFYVSGAAQFYAFGTHLAALGKVRVDASGPVQRVAVIAGTLRLSPGGRAFTLKTGQQYDFRAGKITPFRERDPWYLSQFIGEGDAVLQASRGSVLTGPTPAQFLSAEIGQLLASGARLKTGKNAWAEVGFSGGGYLRLQADSQLRVLGVEKTSAGREVLLQLEAGSAWNVVQKGVGGYQLSTPTVTTAVRGTVFRVDASGLVKVFGGAVSLPSQGDAVIGQGAQRETAGKLGGLKTDALDTFNIALDAERARKTLLEVPQLTQVGSLNLSVTSNPSSRVSVSLGGREYPLTGQPIAGQPGSGGNWVFTLQETLPEGRYTMVVRAARPEKTVELTQQLTIDRTPPLLKVTKLSVEGAALTITGTVSDNFTALPLLRAELGGQVYTLHASGPFSWTLPLGTSGGDPSTPEELKISATDEAGNRNDALLP